MSQDSVIISLLSAFWERLSFYYGYSGLKKLITSIRGFFSGLWLGSAFRRAVVSRTGLEASLRGGFIGRLSGALERYGAKPLKSKLLLNSVFLNSLKEIFDGIPHTSTRSFGFMLAAFCAVLAAFNRSGTVFYLALAGIAAGAVFILINRSLYNLYVKSFFAKLVGGLFLPEKNPAEDKPVVGHHFFYGFCGLILGFAMALLDFNTFVLAAGAVVGGVLVIYKTEIGVFAAAFLMPIAPTKIILGVCAVTVLSYFIKAFVTKALPFKFGLIDLFALLFAVMLVYGTVISYSPQSSLVVSATYILFILFYIAARNTLRTKNLLFAALSLLAVSGLLVSLYGVYQQVTGNFIETASWIDVEMFEDATSRVYSTMGNPNVLGEYLLFPIPIALAMLYYFKKPFYKIAALGVLGVSALCMIYTQSRGAWLGLVLVVVAFAFIYDKKLLIFGVIAALLMPLLLPETVITRFLSIGSLTDSSTSYRVNIWMACLTMLKTVWMSGIGPGYGSFSFMYQKYAYNAVNAPHSHNLYLQIIIDLGVLGIIVFIGLMLIYYKNLLSKIRQSGDKFVKAAAAAILAGMTGYLFQGLTDYVWYNYRMVAFFWFVLAVAASLCALPESMETNAESAPNVKTAPKKIGGSYI